MRRKPPPPLTPQELVIMKVVWQRRRATVREVHDAVSAQRPIAYTTVMTLMGILEEKGFLEKTAEARAHLYRPTRPRHQVLGAMVREFVDRVFDGAPNALLLQLAKDNQLTDAQRRMVTKLLKEGEE